MATTTLRRQESEVAKELKLALEEACLEAGVTLSPAVSPSAWWLFGEDHGAPAVDEFAGWLSTTRRRSYRSSSLNTYRKLASPLLDAMDTLGEQPEEESADENNNTFSASAVIEEVEEEPAPQEMSLKERLRNAKELDVLAEDFNWRTLLSLHRTEHAESEEDERSDARDSFGSVEVTVNSGGVVYFAMFQSSSSSHAKHGEQENGSKGEAAAVFKFGLSRLATQSERLGIEIARHLGVATPQARVIHSNTSEWNDIQDAVETVKETAEANDDEVGVQTCEELLEALHLSGCMLIMGFICGKPLAESPQAFAPEKVALKTASALGRTLVLDLVLRNEDRLVCHELGWRGNPGNLLVTEKVPHGSNKLGPPSVDKKAPTPTAFGRSQSVQHKRSQFFTKSSTQSANELRSHSSQVHRAQSPDFEGTDSHPSQEESEATAAEATLKEADVQGEEHGCLLVAIDSGVPRRPPGMKVEHDRRVYAKTVELLLNDDEVAANLLREISFGYLGPPFEDDNESSSLPGADQPVIVPNQELDHAKVTKAFQRGVVAGIRDMQILRMFLLKLFSTLDHLLRDFMVSMSKHSQEARGEDSKKRHGSKPGSPARQPGGIGRGEGASPRGHLQTTPLLSSDCASSSPPQQERLTPKSRAAKRLELQHVDGHNGSSSPLNEGRPIPNSSLNSGANLPQESPRSSTSNSPLAGSVASDRTPRSSPRLLASGKVSTPPGAGESPGTSPRVASPNKISPLRNWHGKGSPGRLTIKLKDVSNTAKVDCEVSKQLEWWDEKLRREGQKLCREHGFTTGFLEGGGTHSLVDSYELKVRLEHILERMMMISNGSDTERPSCVLPHVYIGGALAARSVHTLQRLGITHVLCLCSSDLDAPDAADFPDHFKYQHFRVKDMEDENIASYFEGACAYVEGVEAAGGKVLVHCFEGKSRSATVVLAYLMLRKGYTLAQAWSAMKAAHRRTRPNDGFMKTLVELDTRLYGKSSMSFLQRRPTAQRCPVCDKFSGLSVAAFHQHFQRAHPGVPLPPSLHPNAPMS